jgi:hypothetical protein
MDTTFKVIRIYHTAILIAVSHNVGIPLAYAFGPKESIELYDSFYTAFDVFDINIRAYILESDQGSALKSVGTRHPRHIFCLRHVLKSLQKGCGRFASLVGNLIRARAAIELNLLVEIYTPDFNQVCEHEGPEKDQLLRCLKKVGLVMHDGQICCEDEEAIRWRQVSMLARVDTNMPSTSNTIECMNGHLNENTPRNNAFWPSQGRLVAIFTHKIENFTHCVIHNAKYEFRKVDRRARFVPEAQMTCELEFFQTSVDHCLCGETVFTTNMYRVDVHCSHRVVFWRQHLQAVAAARRAIPPSERRNVPAPHGLPPGRYELPRNDRITLVRRNGCNECELNIRWVDAPVAEGRRRSRGLEGDEATLQTLEDVICRDAHAYKKRAQVREFVECEWRPGSRFALRYSDTFWDIHRRGVMRFGRKLRLALANGQDPDEV